MCAVVFKVPVVAVDVLIWRRVQWSRGTYLLITLGRGAARR